jgi:hypothetical protein
VQRNSLAMRSASFRICHDCPVAETPDGGVSTRTAQSDATACQDMSPNRGISTLRRRKYPCTGT